MFDFKKLSKLLNEVEKSNRVVPMKKTRSLKRRITFLSIMYVICLSITVTLVFLPEGYFSNTLPIYWGVLLALLLYVCVLYSTVGRLILLVMYYEYSIGVSEGYGKQKVKEWVDKLNVILADVENFKKETKNCDEKLCVGKK